MPLNMSDFSILNHNLCLNQMSKYPNVTFPALEHNIVSKCDPGDSYFFSVMYFQMQISCKHNQNTYN